MIRELSVRLNGVPLGVLSQNARGRMEFSYLAGARRPLSLAMPLDGGPYGEEVCEAYFGGLLPESEVAKKAIALRMGANARNSFSLLRAIGRDCAGAVSLHESEEPIEAGTPEPVEVREIRDSELAGLIRELPRRPLFIGADGLRLSLAGAQDKAAVCLVGDKIALAKSGTPTTHILKPTKADRPDVIFNEYVCLRIAARAGLTVPHLEIRQAEGITFLLIERFDRALRDGTIVRVHQEDFCQASGTPPAYKYQADGGPGAAQAFQLASRFSNPALARARLLDAFLFNLLIGNCDAHAKNYAIMHRDTGDTELAPSYDIVSTAHYPDISKKLAMKVGNKDKASDLRSRHVEAFATEIGFATPFVRRKIADLAARIDSASKQLIPDLPQEGQKIAAFAADHALQLAEHLLADEAL